MTSVPTGGGGESSRHVSQTSTKSSSTSSSKTGESTVETSSLSNMMQSAEEVAGLLSTAENEEAESEVETSSKEETTNTTSEEAVDSDSEGSSGGDGGSSNGDGSSGNKEKNSQSSSSTMSTSSTTSTTSTSSTTSTTDTGTTTDPEEPTTGTSAGPGVAVFEKEKDEIKPIEAKASTYQQSSITQKMSENLGEKAATYSALAKETSTTNDMNLSSDTLTLATYQFHSAASAARSGNGELSKASAIAGYTAVFNELLAKPEKMADTLLQAMPEETVTIVMDLLSGIQAGVIPLEGTQLQGFVDNNTSASSQDAVAGNTVAMILGAFSADVSDNQVQMAEFSNASAEASADIGMNAVDQASGQLDKLQKAIEDMEKAIKKQKKNNQLTQAITIAVTAVAVVAIVAVIVASGGFAAAGAMPLIMLAMSSVALVAQISVYSGGPDVQQAAINAMASAVQAAYPGLGKEDAKMIVIGALTAIAIAGGGAAGGYMGAAALGSGMLAQTGGGSTAAGLIAREQNMSDEEAAKWDMGLSIAVAGVAMGAGLGAGMGVGAKAAPGAATTGTTAAGGANAAKAGTTAATSVDDIALASDDALRTADDMAGAIEMTPMKSSAGASGGGGGNPAQNIDDAALGADDIAGADDMAGGIEMTSMKSPAGASAGGGSKGAQNVDDVALGADDMDDAARVSESAPDGGGKPTPAEAGGAAPVEGPAPAEAMSDLNRTLLQAFFIGAELFQAAGAAVEGVSSIEMAQIYKEQARIKEEMALTEANMTIFYAAADMQNGLAQSITEHYSQSVQQLDSVFSATQQQMAQGQQALADVLGGQSA